MWIALVADCSCYLHPPHGVLGGKQRHKQLYTREKSRLDHHEPVYFKLPTAMWPTCLGPKHRSKTKLPQLRPRLGSPPVVRPPASFAALLTKAVSSAEVALIAQAGVLAASHSTNVPHQPPHTKRAGQIPCPALGSRVTSTRVWLRTCVRCSSRCVLQRGACVDLTLCAASRSTRPVGCGSVQCSVRVRDL